MNLKDLIEQCAETTQAKGFDVAQHGTQLALMATEIAEALELLHTPYSTTITGDKNTDKFIRQLEDICSEFERYRALKTDPHEDHSWVDIENEHPYWEELADIQIRLCSYVGGNGWTEEFLTALQEKMERNKTRPAKHGKGF
jgi:hypothetical protein